MVVACRNTKRLIVMFVRPLKSTPWEKLVNVEEPSRKCELLIGQRIPPAITF